MTHPEAPLEGQPEAQEDKVVNTIYNNIDRWEDEEFALHESGNITRRSILIDKDTAIGGPRTELTEEQLQGLQFNWKWGRVSKTKSYKEAEKRPWLTDKNYFAYIKHLEPKKGKAETAIHTIAEFGKKIVPAKLKGGK